MHTPLRLLLSLPLIVAVAACGPSGSSPSSTTSPTAGRTAAPANDTATGAGPSSAGTSAPASDRAGPSPVPSTSQSDTEWGRIWDALPPGFPTYPGATEADDAGPEPVSGTFAVNEGDANEIATSLQAALEAATYSTEALSGPLEDGSFVLDSVGQGDCRIQVTVTPQGGLTLVAVLYGAACPAP